jgi:hypothetical protein
MIAKIKVVQLLVVASLLVLLPACVGTAASDATPVGDEQAMITENAALLESEVPVLHGEDALAELAAKTLHDVGVAAIVDIASEDIEGGVEVWITDSAGQKYTLQISEYGSLRSVIDSTGAVKYLTQP